MNLEQDCSLLTRVRLGVPYSEHAEAALGADGSGLEEDASLLPSTSSRADEPRAVPGSPFWRNAHPQAEPGARGHNSNPAADPTAALTWNRLHGDTGRRKRLNSQFKPEAVVLCQARAPRYCNGSNGAALHHPTALP